MRCLGLLFLLLAPVSFVVQVSGRWKRRERERESEERDRERVKRETERERKRQRKRQRERERQRMSERLPTLSERFLICYFTMNG